MGTQVVIAGYYPPPFGGESIHVRQLAQLLRTKGFCVSVVNSRRGAPPNQEYRSVSGPLDFIHALLESLNSDAILHLHTNGHSTKSWLVVLAAAAVLRMRGAKGILTLHSGLAPDYLSRLGASRRYALRVAISPFAQIICVNVQIREVLLSLGIQDTRLSVIPAFLGVPTPALLSNADAEIIYGLSPLIIAAGAADPEYGLPLLVEAIVKLRQGLPQLGCIVMGSGGNAELQRLIDSLDLTDRVRCVGEVTHERYISLLSRADVFVRPTYVDGDAVSVREALALGLPVVASDTGYRPDGVILFTSGNPKDLASKITSAVRNPDSSGTRCHPEASASLRQLLSIYGRLGNRE